MTECATALAEGQALFERDCYGAADIKFEAAVNADSLNWEAYFWRGKNRAAMRRFRPALDDIHRAITCAPSQKLVFLLLERTDIYESMEDWHSAIADYDAVIALRPKHIGARTHRARCYSKLRQYRKATDAFEELLSLEPDNIKHLERKIAMLHSLGRYGEGLREVERGIAWFGERNRLPTIRMELQEDQTLWDKLFG